MLRPVLVVVLLVACQLLGAVDAARSSPPQQANTTDSSGSTSSGHGSSPSSWPLVKWVHNLPRYEIEITEAEAEHADWQAFLKLKRVDSDPTFNATSRVYQDELVVSAVPFILAAAIAVILMVLFPCFFCFGYLVSYCLGCHSKYYRKSVCDVLLGLVMVLLIGILMSGAALEQVGQGILIDSMKNVESTVLGAAQKIETDLIALNKSITNMENAVRVIAPSLTSIFPPQILTAANEGASIMAQATKYDVIVMKYMSDYQRLMKGVAVFMFIAAGIFALGFCIAHSCFLVAIGMMAFLVMAVVCLIASVHVPLSLATADLCVAMGGDLKAAETLLDTVLICGPEIEDLENDIEKVFSSVGGVISALEAFPSDPTAYQEGKKLQKVYSSLHEDFKNLESLFNCTYIQETALSLEDEFCAFFLKGTVIVWMSLSVCACSLLLMAFVACHGFPACKRSQKEPVVSRLAVGSRYNSALLNTPYDDARPLLDPTRTTSIYDATAVSVNSPRLVGATATPPVYYSADWSSYSSPPVSKESLVNG